MVETPECIKIFGSEDVIAKNVATTIFHLLDDGYDVVVRGRDLDILVCPIQKDTRGTTKSIGLLSL